MPTPIGTFRPRFVATRDRAGSRTSCARPGSSTCEPSRCSGGSWRSTLPGKAPDASVKYHFPMDVIELRKGILRALDEARKDASDRRRMRDEAAVAFESFLQMAT